MSTIVSVLYNNIHIHIIYTIYTLCIPYIYNIISIYTIIIYHYCIHHIHYNDKADNFSKKSGNVLLVHFGSSIVIGTPPHATNEKHIATR